MHSSMDVESGGHYPHQGVPPPPYPSASPPQYPSASPVPLVPTQTPPPKPSRSFLFGIGSLVLRILTLVLLFIGLIVLAVDSVDVLFTDAVVTYHFGDVTSYRYTFSAILIGFVYTLVQIGLSVYRLVARAQIGKIMLIFDFYGDKFLSYLLATGAAAGFGSGIDLNAYLGYTDFFNKGNAACSMLFIAFVCSIASSIISSYALPRCINSK